MSTVTNRALVVDDEVGIRQLVSRCLCKEGFTCDVARDGIEAAERLQDSTYDLVVTDLRMPSRNGHALACDLLALPERPVVVILTGCIEPRLVKDLMQRGVDDMVFKPIDFEAFAVKVRALVERHNKKRLAGNSAATSHGETDDQIANDPTRICPITKSEYEQRLMNVTQLLPLSSVALDAFHLANSGEQDAGALASIVLRDGVLTAELLRLANSAFYNPSGTPIVNVLDAIVRIGFRRVGAVALATSSRGALTNCMLPWLNGDLMWCRSMAAVIAAAHLEEQGSHQEIGDAPFLGALMHPLGRMVLGLQFPQRYEQLIKMAHNYFTPLQDLERLAFPESHSVALHRVLMNWNLPAEVIEPLRYVADRFETLQNVPEPTRLQVELIKVSVVLARLAVGKWEPWDFVECPPESTLGRLRVRDVCKIVQSTRDDLHRIADSKVKLAGTLDRGAAGQTSGKIRYCNLSENPFDYVRALLEGLEYEIEYIPPNDIGQDVVINCLGTPPLRLKECVSTKVPASRRLLIVNELSTLNTTVCSLGTAIALPTSYGSLSMAIQHVAKNTAL